MKLQVVITTILMALVVCLAKHDAALSNKDGIAGRTGSPLENTCLSSCHNSHPLNSGGGSVTITSPDLVNFVYNPGQTYTLEVTIAKPSVNLFGFAMESLFANGSDAGSFIHINQNETWSKAANINGNIRTSATHQENSGIGAGFKTFVFQWQAPAFNAGPVTFYAAGNAANGNGSTSGDYIYTAQQIVNDSATASGMGMQLQQLKNLRLSPNPAKGHFCITHQTKTSGRIVIEVYRCDGTFVTQLLKQNELPGEYVYNFDTNCLGSNMPGLYLLKITKNNQVSVMKIIVEK